jgi:superfamily I DNA and RNA helicase
MERLLRCRQIIRDRNAGAYFSSIRDALVPHRIRVHNLQDKAFSIPDFQKADCVTLATVYKAKGNEAYSVYLVGIDALFESPTARYRNRAFTAMTRAKGWLYVSGVGAEAQRFVDELKQAKTNFPDLRFKYPNQEQLVYMKRDLVQIDPAEAAEALSRMTADMEPEELENLLRKKLRELEGKRRIKRRKKVS